MPVRIKAVNLHRSYKLNERRARRLAADVLKMIGEENGAELELVFMDDKSIRQFNKKYRRENRATDVLSFRLDRVEPPRRAFLGEIMISLDTALSNSKTFGTNFTDEVTLYIIHGILHLFGYDDESLSDSRKMVREQNRILDKLCSCKNSSEVLTPR